MRILIDADGCPVTKNAIKIANEYKIEVIIFCDTSHIFDYEDIKVITVGKGADSADYALVNEVHSGDIIVTQDYGLSAMALAKRGCPVTQNGMIIDNQNIDLLLATRHAAKKARMAGKHLKGPSKRTKEQDVKFETVLRKMIEDKLKEQKDTLDI